MSDLLWYFPPEDFPATLTEWQGMSLKMRYSGDAPRVLMYPFTGENPLASGLTALFAEWCLRWRGPAFRLLVTKFGDDEEGGTTWDAGMLDITPQNYPVEWAIGSATISGSYTNDTLQIALQNGTDAHFWTLNGTLPEIVAGMLPLIPQVLEQLGIHALNWKPEEAPDIQDAAGLTRLLAAWGEVNIRRQLVENNLEEHDFALASAIRRMLDAATIGSAFAAWVAVRALTPVVADSFSPQQATAEDALLALASLYPRVAWPSLALALSAWDSADFERTAQLLETAVESDVRVVDAWQMLAILYEEANELDRAEQVCREAISGNVADALLYYRLGSLLVDYGDDEEEDEARIQEGITLLQTAEGEGLIDPEIPMRLMDAYYSVGDDAASWDVFRRLIEYDKDGSYILEVADNAEMYLFEEEGLAVLKDEAEKQNRYVLYAAYLRALGQLGRVEEALPLLDKVRALATDDYDKAATALLALELADPDFEANYTQIAMDIDEGVIPDSGMTDILHAALAKEPMFADGAATLAEAYEARDELDAALSVLDEALKLLPDHLELVLGKADALWVMERDQEAEQVLLAALERHPEDVALLSRLGEYYMETGDGNRAALYLAKAEFIDPYNPELDRVKEDMFDGGDDFEGYGLVDSDDEDSEDDEADTDVKDDEDTDA